MICVSIGRGRHKQMKAEREKRAQILDAEGSREAAILEADGRAEAVRREADAKRYQLETEANGEADAITIVYRAITDAHPDDKLIAIQYLDTLKAMADGQSTKIYLPYEASGVLGSLGGIQEIFKDKGPSANGRPSPNGQA